MEQAKIKEFAISLKTKTKLKRKDLYKAYTESQEFALVKKEFLKEIKKLGVFQKLEGEFFFFPFN